MFEEEKVKVQKICCKYIVFSSEKVTSCFVIHGLKCDCSEEQFEVFSADISCFGEEMLASFDDNAKLLSKGTAFDNQVL